MKEFYQNGRKKYLLAVIVATINLNLHSFVSMREFHFEKVLIHVEAFDYQFQAD
jgi:hypothetical protein